MKYKRELVILITVLAAVIFCITLYRAVFYAATDEIPLPPGVTDEALANKDSALYPVTLSIPKINVQAKITDVGITSRGNMGTPTNYSDVGWYRYGILPGQLGSAVMAGHVDNGLSLPGVFSNLKDLSIGDDVYVATVGGERLHFIVSAVDTYDFNDKGTNVFKEKDAKLLRLITCTGSWVSQYKTHDKRLVVTAVLSSK
ncbi:MAG: class F sortase [Patescibacteria group bacterium]